MSVKYFGMLVKILKINEVFALAFSPWCEIASAFPSREPKQKTTRTRKLCDCEQWEPHKSSRYELCAQNKKNLAKLADIKAAKEKSDCVSSSHTNTLIDTTKLT